ncbi:unnamed protein product [Cylicocyclus nassatus]|uniref:Uncharacterized protein n=1 Tax=Cylicocyclus nassatus TaxID=53992 RepID=A0AA36HI50_CYLNA|nr:unnamed protein product [Cylicocyclus nassatus]
MTVRALPTGKRKKSGNGVIMKTTVSSKLQKEDVRLSHSVNNYMESNNTVISKPRHVFFFYSVVIVVRFYPTPPHYSTSHSEVMAMQCAPTGIALRAICSSIENSFDTSQAHPDTSYTLPATIIEQDRIREALHEAEGLQNQIEEMIKSYAKNERLDLLQEISEVMRNGIRQLPLETLENRFARRQEMQTTGAGPTPVRIQSYKSRFQLKLEKKKQEKH